MSIRDDRPAARATTDPSAPAPAASAQSRRRGPSLGYRRAIFAVLVLGSIVSLMATLALAMGADGLNWIELAMLAAFAGTLPWLVIGFWNALIGALILIAGRGQLHGVIPLTPPRPGATIVSRVAVVVPVHEEDPELVFRHLRTVIASLDLTGCADAFDVFILSDTRNDVTAQREARLFAQLQATMPSQRRLHYRRRAATTDFKAGNIRDFCDRWGGEYDLMVVLDADSVMSGRAMVRLVRLMEANPNLGILQTLVVGLPSQSAFARLFQFGMRHGMRSYTVGSAWWQGDSGPYWGHNAIIRLAPFIAHCRLPHLRGRPPMGGPILSHDQVEAVLMRRAGFHVRVLPLEDGSFEANPPTLPDFAKRDLRWCQGNLQYLRLLGMLGLRPLGRVQLLLAILMYTGSPCWLAFLMLGTVNLLLAPTAAAVPPLVAWLGWAPIDTALLGLGLFVAVITMSLAPKLFGLLYAFASGRERRAFGGAWRLLTGAVCEVVFASLLAPVVSVAQTLFMASLMLRRPVSWRAQVRTGRPVTWQEAVGSLWPQTVIGGGWLLLLAAFSPAVLPWAMPVIAGLLFAIPLAVFSSHASVGKALVRLRLCATREELDPPIEVRAVCPWLRGESLADRPRQRRA